MKVDIAIMTIREDEFSAVRKHFQTKRQRIPGGRTYLIGEVKTEKRAYAIAIARSSEQGTDASQRLAHYIIHNLDPYLILVVGIAGGVPRDEFTLGDVVVSSRIVNLNVDAWHPDGTTGYMTRGGPSHPLVDDIVSLLPGDPLLANWTDKIQQERPILDPEQAIIVGDNEWREKVHQSLCWHFGEKQNQSQTSTFTTGSILSSNHLMKDSTRLGEILKTHRSIFAVEMEVAGVYEAAQGIDYQYPVMAIRGISDIVGLQRDRRWTEYACQAAAAFTYAFIMTDPLDLPLNLVNSQRFIVSSAINITGRWQEITSKYTRVWSLTQSGDSITGEGTHKSLYHSSNVSITGRIDDKNIHINAYIIDNKCTINYLLHLEDKQAYMDGEWISYCNGEKGRINLFKSK